MTRVYVSIGSNQERESNVRAAIAALRERFGQVILSSVYETDAVGFAGDPFLNLVAGFDTELVVTASQVLDERVTADHRRRGPIRS